MATKRAHWGSRAGFILAAAGSAVGLGNIWKFPYVTGTNGGGWFVLIYLACVAVVGLPIMMAEIFIGRTAQNSPVGAFRALSRPGSAWMSFGWMGVMAAFLILSFYSVVAGWSMHYAWLSVTNAFSGKDAEAIAATFTGLYESPGLNLFWHVFFMVLTVGIVIGGVQAGLERWAKILMPALFIMLLILLIEAFSMSGFGDAMRFVFAPNSDEFEWKTATLAALGQAFFSMSLGMGALITYGSYLRRDDDLVTTSITIGALDTGVALLAAMILFPITFSYGLEPGESVGLAFINLPIAFSQMEGGPIWGSIFFGLLTFAALTSSISLLEVAVSYFIDERGWGRGRATVLCGSLVAVIGIPSALSGGTQAFGDGLVEVSQSVFGEGRGKNWFDLIDYLTSNVMLPLGGMGIATFVAWRVGSEAREQAFRVGSRWGSLYWGWIRLLRYVVPIGVVLVFINALGFYDPAPETLWGWLKPPAVLLMFLVTGIIAVRRGYNFVLWLLAGGIVGWIVLAALPNVRTEGPPDPETRVRRRRGDLIGAALSLLTAVAAAIWLWVLDS